MGCIRVPDPHPDRDAHVDGCLGVLTVGKGVGKELRRVAHGAQENAAHAQQTGHNSALHGLGRSRVRESRRRAGCEAVVGECDEHSVEHPPLRRVRLSPGHGQGSASSVSDSRPIISLGRSPAHEGDAISSVDPIHVRRYSGLSMSTSCALRSSESWCLANRPVGVWGSLETAS